MSYNKQKLELNWIGKEKRPKLEPRILLEDLEKSYHASHQISSQDIFDNKLIFGDNLLALKALEQEYMGKVKCIYIDPPYNTGNAFEHYEDGLEHSIWLSLMRDRLELLHHLLADDGALFMQLDDNEIHYAKILCDELFGRNNFVANLIWHKKRGKDNSSRYFSTTHDHILVYAKNFSKFYINRIELDDVTKKAYVNPDNDSRGAYRILGLWARQQGGSEYEYTTKTGKFFSKRLWLVNLESMQQLDKEDRLLIKGNNLYRKFFLSENKGSIPETIWIGLSNNANAKDELKKIFINHEVELFNTPKPEHLLQRIIKISTNPGDLVLDSFAGSGTTGAVAHKMGRKWIMIELGEHCHTHIIPRLKQVIDGTDQGGISKSVNWQGGGGFRYYRLAPSLLQKDPWGQWIISREYNAAMLSEAMCKHMGFTYAPDENHYWMQGYSTETDYIYVTTSAMTHEQLRIMSEEVGSHRTLLICGTAFDTKSASFENLTLTKIPRAVLEKCEWGRDDYSLNVSNLEPVIVVKENNKNKDIAQAELDLFE
ncbi:site-specific DNA-methyltransferase [Bartonella sp. ML70XJBT]|uniref:site-specific DNA-methyltransferase n=1 Tax=Bartonella sp. ML70XJBT TaxID=3019096 RepID=UPI00236054E4|nr:site-specific DNA-methyltransferase [Bartonella sp. ML70XJBT]